MNKIIKISVIFILLTLLGTNNADASFFDWKNVYSSNNFLLSVSASKNWMFSETANKSEGISIPEKLNEPEKELKVIKVYTVRATAYSSTVDQTDDTPFITASGTRVRDGIIAANFLPFGTVVRIPEIYGDKTFVVEDRMHQRYWYNVDVWFPERQLAKEFGAQKVTIEVVTVNEI